MDNWEAQEEMIGHQLAKTEQGMNEPLAKRLRAQVDAVEAKAEREHEARAKADEEVRATNAKRAIRGLVARCREEAKGSAAEGHCSATFREYSREAYDAAERVAKALREEDGFEVVVRREHTAVRINGDGYAVGGNEPYAVWEIKW